MESMYLIPQSSSIPSNSHSHSSMDAGSDGDDDTQLHIVMFPWLAMGHLIPFLHLSKILALRGHRISFISTPRNLHRLPKIPTDISSLINLIPFPIPHVPNLPHHAECSMDIPQQKAQYLKIAFDLLKSPLADFLDKTEPKPDWIIYDYPSHWLPPLAAKLGISKAYFSLFSAATMAFIGPPSAILSGEDTRSTAEDFTVVPNWIPFKSDVVYRIHEVTKYVDGSAGDNESGSTDTERFAASIAGSELVLFRTCVDLEPEWFSLVCEFYKKPVLSVGVLPPEPEDDLELVKYENWGLIKEWLDKQRANSVVYVALGSEATLSQNELNELALGLEKCGSPFFWVLRNPPWFAPGESQPLPDGFEERVKNHSLVHVGWVPQVNILSHPAIKGFLTHCGWNSVIEGLAFGRVLILFPVMNDQGLNTRLLTAKKLGIEIPRDAKDGTFSSESVRESVRIAMVSEEGELARSNAMKARDMFVDKTNNSRSIRNLIHYLVTQRKDSM